MHKYKAHCVALAHHGDDQIETVLMRLVRGSTSKGYAGIPIKRPFGNGYIIRPFCALIDSKLNSIVRIMACVLVTTQAMTKMITRAIVSVVTFSLFKK